MIPLKDRNPTRRVPIVNIIIIVLNIAVFMYQVFLGRGLEGFLYKFGVVPDVISNSISTVQLSPKVFFPLFSSMFLHGGWLHLGGNMLYLWVFGDNVEDKLGRGRYLVFYLLCGIAASVAHIIIDPHSTIPTVGASGAISGVLGAYLLMFPKARVLTLIPIFVFLQFAELPALVVLGFWFVMQFFNGLISLGYETAGMGGVAWWAHIGGFVAGMVLVFPFKKFR
ncbi:MAG: rhomboid family intramembrane serine protease [Ignavibacteriales bacterium]|nr:rhomboid family intramembrane serine protease [Ignavibacteriales bacterium]